jgi:hypothetical protein
MRRISIFMMLFLALPCIRLHAQRASVEFTSEYSTSIVQITPAAIGYNGVSTPITFDPVPDHDPKFGRDFSFIITSAPVAVGSCHSLTVDLHGSITIHRSFPKSHYRTSLDRNSVNPSETSSSGPDDSSPSFGSLRANVEIVDAETGAVLRKEVGLRIALDNARPGNDTSATQHLVLDISSIQTNDVILRFSGINMTDYNPIPLITIDNSLSAEIDRVH